MCALKNVNLISDLASCSFHFHSFVLSINFSVIVWGDKVFFLTEHLTGMFISKIGFTLTWKPFILLLITSFFCVTSSSLWLKVLHQLLSFSFPFFILFFNTDITNMQVFHVKWLFLISWKFTIAKIKKEISHMRCLKSLGKYIPPKLRSGYITFQTYIFLCFLRK